MELLDEMHAAALMSVLHQIYDAEIAVVRHHQQKGLSPNRIVIVIDGDTETPSGAISLETFHQLRLKQIIGADVSKTKARSVYPFQKEEFRKFLASQAQQDGSV